jgi:ankyrin repeat protein
MNFRIPCWSRALIAPTPRWTLLCLVALSFSDAHSGEAAPDPLLRAVSTGDAAEWQARLQANADVHSRYGAGNTALHLAALNHDLAAVNAMLGAGAEVDARNTAAATPLLYGAGHAGIIRALLARGADPNAASKLKITPLMVAVSHPDSLEVARLLIEAGADVHAKTSGDVDATLIKAVTAGDRRTVELLISRGAARDGKTVSMALSKAAFAGDVALVELLIEHGADVNYTEPLAGHALNFAFLAEELDVARLLLEKGADPTLRSPVGHGTPPLVFAAYNQTGDVSVVRALITRGVDVNSANDHGATALAYALRSGPHTPLVEYLRRADATPPVTARSKPIPNHAVPSTAAGRAALVRERMPATLKLLQRSSDAFLENAFVQRARCTSCHGQDLPAAAYELAHARGFPVDEVSVGRQLAALLPRWTERGELARQMIPPLPGSPVSIAYGLFGLRAAGYPADEMTDAMVRYLIRTQRPDGAWVGPIRRPPMEDGTFVTTGWVALSVRDYPSRAMKSAAADSQARSARWLARQKPAMHNEAVFQLLGLHWSGEPRDGLTEYVRRLASAQRADGGWSQLAGLESDAWATGSALYALHEAGGMVTTNEVYERGVAFLLRTQFEDGSWWVRSRSWPFQPHFNGQFPHGKDQWISQGATAWAAMALLLTLEETPPAPAARGPAELMAKFKSSPVAPRKQADAVVPVDAQAAAVDFARDIRPLFERSCTGCHGGEKPRAGFAIVSRESLLKGGASGEPAITPGYSDDSTMIQYVTGRIEDLEMPPLDRREKYPPLTAAEADMLRAWIDAGAPWAP